MLFDKLSTTNIELSETRNELQVTRNELAIFRNEFQETNLKLNQELSATPNKLQATRDQLSATQNQLASTCREQESTRNELTQLKKDISTRSTLPKHQTVPRAAKQPTPRKPSSATIPRKQLATLPRDKIATTLTKPTVEEEIILLMSEVLRPNQRQTTQSSYCENVKRMFELMREGKLYFLNEEECFFKLQLTTTKLLRVFHLSSRRHHRSSKQRIQYLRK